MKLKRGITFIILIIFSLGTLVFFQNCSDVTAVKSKPPPPPPVVLPKGISGKVCTSNSAVADVSRYEVNRFVILNLTAFAKEEALLSDANMNGIDDSLESDMNAIPTIKLSNADTDEDGIPNFIEEIRGFSPSVKEMHIDGSDQDGVDNFNELVLGSDPSSALTPKELNLYSLDPIATETGCDPTQKLFKFKVEKLQRVELKAFTDVINPAETSISHEKDENVFLVYIHLVPDRITSPDKKLYKIFKFKKDDADVFLDFSVGDFNLLPNE